MSETSPSCKCENVAEPSVAETHLNFIRVELLLMPRHESRHVFSQPRPLPSRNGLIELEGTKGHYSAWQSRNASQTPSCLINKCAVRNNSLSIFSPLVGKISVGGGGGYLNFLFFFFPVGEMMRQTDPWGVPWLSL